MDLMTYALCKGNGGGGSSSEPFVITVTLNQEYTNVADKTYSEILSAFESGRELVCVRNGTKYVLDGIRANGDFTFSAKLEDTGYSTITITANNYISNIVHYFVPPASVANKGKVLRGNSTGSFVASDVNFIVTLTPTELDYSGTMDKTVAEINTAYEAGQQIVFRVMMSETEYMDVDCTARWFDGSTYPSFNGFIVDDAHDMIIFAGTGAQHDGTISTYFTELYSLTPVS